MKLFRPRRHMVLLMLFVGAVHGRAFAQCCSDADCTAEARTYAEQLMPLLHLLGTPPGPIEERFARLDSLKDHDPERAARLDRSYAAYLAWSDGHPDRMACFNAAFDAAHADELSWEAVLAMREDHPRPVRSPEFRRGWAVQAAIGQGAQRIFDPGETYLFRMQALVGYTFAAGGTGGRWRVLAGPGLQYGRTCWRAVGTVRVERRICDLGMDLISLGNVKAVAEGTFGQDIQWAWTGPALELGPFGVELLAGKQLDGGGWGGQALLSVRFPFTRH